MKKWIFLLLIIMVLLTGCGNKIEKEEKSAEVIEENVDYTNLSDEEFLSKIGEFNLDGLNKVVWSFKKDKTGTITTDGIKTYDMKWELKKDKLVIKIDWVYSEKYEYGIVFNKDNKSFTLDDNVVFVKKSNVVNKNVFVIDKKLLGVWSYKSDKGNYMWYFDNNYCYVGYYNDQLYVIDKYYWNVIDDVLELYSPSLKKNDYNFVLDDGTLLVYRDNEIINTFKKEEMEVIIAE